MEDGPAVANGIRGTFAMCPATAAETDTALLFLLRSKAADDAEYLAPRDLRDPVVSGGAGPHAESVDD